MQTSTGPSRRTIVKGAAWATPVIAVGVAAPQASASTAGGGTEPNAVANYFWASVPGPDGQPVWSTLYYTGSGASTSSSAQFSTQLEYRSDPWIGPPSAPIFVITVTFNQPVTISNLAGWTVDPTGAATTFTFTSATNSQFGPGLTFSATPAQGDDITTLTSTATLAMTAVVRPDGSSASWTGEVSKADAASRPAV